MGEIITFYSYKGGTGRTMALANTAVLLAREAQGEVLMIDWDLEAPGLEYYFRRWTGKTDDQPGIFDFVEKAKTKLPKMAAGREDIQQLERFFQKIEAFLIPVKITSELSNLFLIKAGKNTEDYAQRTDKFNWTAFFHKIPGFFPLFAKYLSAHYDYIFVDSRTGHTDIGGICTMLLPEKLVLVFTPNEQGLEGVLHLARKAAQYRMNSNDLRTLLVFPLPSRVDLEEETLRNQWKEEYRQQFEDLFREIYALPSSISLEPYFNRVQIRHASRYAYGEKIAVLEESNGINSLHENYQAFALQLTEVNEIWVNEPFARMASPYEVFFLFAEKDRLQAEIFIQHIRPLARQNAIILGQNASELLSVEQLNDTFRRKIGSGGVDFLVLFLSPALVEQSDKWMFELQETINQSNGLGKYKIIPILISKVKPLEILDDIPILPSRRISVEESLNLDETWGRVVSDFRKRLIVYKEKIQSKTYA